MAFEYVEEQGEDKDKDEEPQPGATQDWSGVHSRLHNRDNKDVQSKNGNSQACFS